MNNNQFLSNNQDIVQMVEQQPAAAAEENKAPAAQNELTKAMGASLAARTSSLLTVGADGVQKPKAVQETLDLNNQMAMSVIAKGFQIPEEELRIAEQ